MGDLFAPPPGYPVPPPELDTPPPNFADAGKNFAIGVAASGVSTGWWAQLAKVFKDVFSFIVGWTLAILGNVLAFIVGNLTAADAIASQAYGELIAREVESLFGLNYNSAALQGIANSKGRADLGSQVANVILTSIFSPTSAASGSGVEPSDAAAKKYLGTVMTMELEGWIHSWVLDALSVHELEKFGDLKDGISSVLGLGRMSRQVFAAPLKVFVHDPYQALLNDRYRPTPLPHTSAIRQFYRGELSRDDLERILGREGWSTKYIDYLISEHQKYLSDADVDYLVSRGAWNSDQGSKYLQEQGWDAATAQRRLAIMADKRVDHFRREIITAGEAAFVRGDIPATQFQTIVQNSGLSDDEQTWTIRAAGVKRELHITNLSRSDIQTMILKGVLNFTDLQAWAVRNNMPIDQERFLELLLAEEGGEKTAAAKAKAEAAAAKAAAQQLKAQAAIAKAAQAKAQAADKGISVSQAETLVVDGLWTFDHLTTFLTARNYGPDAIAAITDLLHARITKAAAHGTTATGIRATAAAKGLPLGQLEKAAVEGILTLAEFQAALAPHGFTAEETQVLVELTQHAREVQAVKDQAAADRAAKAGHHEASLAEIERAARLGITPADNYTLALQNAGFNAASVALLRGILDSQIAADRKAAATRTGAVAAGNFKGVSLPQLEQEVVAGIRTLDDYTAALLKLGYSAGDVADLAALLKLRIQHAHTVADKSVAAGEALAQRSLSLTDIERSVKLGILTIDDYKAALKAADFDPHTIDILAHALTQQVANASKAGVTTTGAVTKAKAKSISLSEFQRAVLEGVRTIGDYSNLLTGLGYSAADVTTMVHLQQLKLDHAAAAARKHADAVGLATDRGISLADEERAVLSGDKTMANYDALLKALGFDAIDRSTLDKLLAAKIAAAAAKAAAPPAATGGGTPPV